MTKTLMVRVTKLRVRIWFRVGFGLQICLGLCLLMVRVAKTLTLNEIVEGHP